MRIALRALEGRSDAVEGALTADDAVAALLCMNGEMILRQCDRSVGSSARLHRLPIGSEQLHQGMHELLSEIELPRSILADRPQLEGIDDAHVEQPPCEARPSFLALPSDQVGVVQLIAHVDGAGAVEVVSDSARAANGNLVAGVVPALQ